MVFNRKQEDGFLNDVVGPEILDKAIDWIKNNLGPEDVFSEEELSRWAKDNYVMDE